MIFWYLCICVDKIYLPDLRVFEALSDKLCRRLPEAFLHSLAAVSADSE